MPPTVTGQTWTHHATSFSEGALHEDQIDAYPGSATIMPRRTAVPSETTAGRSTVTRLEPTRGCRRRRSYTCRYMRNPRIDHARPAAVHSSGRPGADGYASWRRRRPSTASWASPTSALRLRRPSTTSA